MTQHDIKRILAYSTISQIGYMFLALGVGAWAAAIYHFVTHAFFKSALFLGAGVRHQGARRRARHLQDGRPAPASAGHVQGFHARRSDARRRAAPDADVQQQGPHSEPGVAIRSGAAVPSGRWGSLAHFLTAVYTFRMVFVVFFGREQNKPAGKPSLVDGRSVCRVVVPGGCRSGCLSC